MSINLNGDCKNVANIYTNDDDFIKIKGLIKYG